MEFLTNSSLPFLDGYVTTESQSVLFEVMFWTTLYLIYANVFSRLLRSAYRKLPLWKTSHLREGILCGNGRDDAVLLTVLGTHHFAAAALMLVGVHTDSPDLWRHGYLLETGFEIADLLSMVVPMYPYRDDNVKPDMVAGIVFHHLAGIPLAPFVMTCGLYKNVHMQAIGSWLLAGAGVSCAMANINYRLDYDKQMKYAALVFCSNVAFFLYARWYVFPIESLALLEDVANDPETYGGAEKNFTTIQRLLRFGGFVMAVFNLAVVADVVPKTIRYVKRALDGGRTPIETKPIPSSRDSILLQRSRQQNGQQRPLFGAVEDEHATKQNKKLL